MSNVSFNDTTLKALTTLTPINLIVTRSAAAGASANFSSTSFANTAATVTITTTRTNEIVIVSWVGEFVNLAANANEITWAIDVDGVTQRDGYKSGDRQTTYANGSFVSILEIATPGSHVLHLAAKVSAGNFAFDELSTDKSFCALQAA